MADILQALYDSPIGVAMRENATAFPWAETAHVIAITTMLGMLAIVDLRLLGVRAHRRSALRLMRELLPYTWVAFVLAVITGLLLFASDPMSYAAKGPFLGKMIFLVLAGINMAIFHLTAYRNIAAWDEAPRPPLGARIAGASSLTLWIAVVFAGRWIGFV